MAERAEFLSAIGSRSPFAAQARICAAISAFIVDVLFAWGSMAAASSSTVFINWINSGRKAAPVVFMVASCPKRPWSGILSLNFLWEQYTNDALRRFLLRLILAATRRRLLTSEHLTFA